MTLVNKVKESPMLAIAVTIGVLAGGVAGAVQIWNVLDKTHVTEAELLIYDLKAHTFASQQFKVLTDQLDDIATIGKCRWLKSEIRSLEDAIYVRERDKAGADYINELKKDLKDLNDDYDALGCALKLA